MAGRANSSGQRNGAICRATIDGAVWITHLKRRDTPVRGGLFKLPATRAIALAGIDVEVPEVGIALDAQVPEDHTYREIAYHEHAGVGDPEVRVLQRRDEHRSSAGGSARRLRTPAPNSTREVIVLLGGDDYFSNGIHLNEIEAADNPAQESWRNLQAIDDLVKDVLETDSHLVVLALAGDAAAGGVPLALAGGLRPRTRGHRPEPLLPAHGRPIRVGVLDLPPATARRRCHNGAAHLSTVPAGRLTRGGQDAATRRGPRRGPRRVSGGHCSLRGTGRARRAAPGTPKGQATPAGVIDERVKPLEAYRQEEMARCHECFFGPDPPYHHARRSFVYKLPTPDTASEEPARVAS